MTTKAILGLLTVTASGCGAVYHYDRTPDNCTLTIISGREVMAGDVAIDKNCSVTGGAESLTNNEKAFEAINSLVNKIP